MIFTQYYLDCLSQASYLIGDESSGRAVVVDPRRDVGEYVDDANAAGLTIEMVIETHFHADFLSGHLELANRTGAKIAYSSVAEPEYEFQPLGDGERMSLGEITLEFRHTPGHTPESLSIVVWEKESDATPYGVLTGDTLFIGDVGRPDLLTSVGYSRDELAGQLYDSLHGQLLTLPDDTRVYPGHGAGSACGKNLSTDTWSTIGDQRVTNYAVAAPDRSTFIELVTEGQTTAPAYFAYDAALNKQDRSLHDETVPPRELTLVEVDELTASGAILVDSRDAEVFSQGHLRGSINVGLEGRYAEYAGSVIEPNADMVLVTEPGAEIESKTRLARIGFDRIVGSLADPYGTMEAHPDRTNTASRLTSTQLAVCIDNIADLQLVDVRQPGEVSLGTIEGAVKIPVGQLQQRFEELDTSRPTIVFCAGGYRSAVAASVLRLRDFNDVSDLIGGYSAWIRLGNTR